MKQIQIEAESEGSEWAALKAGFFGGSYDRFQEVIAAVPSIIPEWEKNLYF